MKKQRVKKRRSFNKDYQNIDQIMFGNHRKKVVHLGRGTTVSRKV